MGMCESNHCLKKQYKIDSSYRRMDNSRQQICLNRLSIASEDYLVSSDQEELKIKLCHLFNRYDKNKDGKLDYHETYQFIKHNMKYEDTFDLHQLTQDLLAGAYFKDDGTICRNQFYQLFIKL